MKKLITAGLALSLLMWNVMIPGMVFAADDPVESNDSDTIETSDKDTFDLDILSTTDQGQDYFDDKQPTNTPVVNFILDIINFITQIIGAIAMLLIIIGGVMMIVSEGDENRLQKGKGILGAAIVGLVIAMFSYIIVRFVQSLFYLNL